MSRNSRKAKNRKKNSQATRKREASKTQSKPDRSGGIFSGLFASRYRQTTIPGTDVVVADTSKVGVIPLPLRIIMVAAAVALVAGVIIMIILGGRNTIRHKDEKRYPYSYFTLKNGSLRVDVDGHKNKKGYLWRAVCDDEKICGIKARKKESGGRASFVIKPLDEGTCRVQLIRDNPKDERDVICVIDFDLRFRPDGKGGQQFEIEREESEEYTGLMTGGKESGLSYELWPVPGEDVWHMTTKAPDPAVETTGDTAAFRIEGKTSANGTDKKLTVKEEKKAAKKGELSYLVTISRAEGTKKQEKAWAKKKAQAEVFVGDASEKKAICLNLTRGDGRLPEIRDVKEEEHEFAETSGEETPKIPKRVKKIAGNVSTPKGWTLERADTFSIETFTAVSSGDDSASGGKKDAAMITFKKGKRSVTYIVSKKDLRPLFDVSVEKMEVQDEKVAGIEGTLAGSDSMTLFLWTDEEGRSCMLSVDKNLKKKKLAGYLRDLEKEGA